MTDAPERITKIHWLYHPEDLDEIKDAMIHVEYIRADLAKSTPIPQAAMFMVRDQNTMGLLYEALKLEVAEPEISDIMVKFSTALRALSHEGGE